MNRKAIFLAVASLFADAAFSQAVPVNTLPTNGSVVAGSATIGTSGSTMTVTQGSARALINWESFSIGRDMTVHIDHATGSKAVTANRVPAGTAQSVIEGVLSATGNVMILNANGVLFGSTARVNVGGLVASTGDVNNGDFAPGAVGSIPIKAARSGRVTNEARPSTSYPTAGITVAETGLAAFVAPSVVNSGVITAIKGRIVLASAEEATLSLNGNNLYELAVTKGIADGSIDNTGTLKATGAGGAIILSALDAANAVSGLINLEGMQQATRIEVHGGVVELKSDLDATTVAGSSGVVNVSKTTAGGGQIQDGVDIAKSGGSVNVAAGTYAENLTISKALTLHGAGRTQTILDPVSGDAVTIGGNMGAGASLLIDGFTFRDAPRYGVNVIGSNLALGDLILGELTIQNSDFVGNGQNGFALLGSATTGVPGLGKVSLLNDNFVGNGTAVASSLGYGDILFNYYNRDATFQNLHITGNGEFIGIQIRGASPTANHPMAAGTMVFENVTIGGSFLRPDVPNGNPTWHNVGTWNPGGPGDAIHLLEYSSVANVSFNNVAINLDAGHGMFLEGLGSTLNIGNTTFGLNTNLAVLGSGTTITAREKVSRNIFIGSNDNGLVTNVDASHASFTDAGSGFAIEDRVYHALDTAGLGLATWNPGHLYVTPDSGSIQRGIDACVCGTVHVGAGTFTEQVRINKSLVLVGSGANATIVKAPTSLVADASGMKNILTIGGSAATDVEVSGFTFKGPALGLDAGIFVRDGAHAHIHHNSVIDIRDAVALSGTQHGAGIFVGRALFSTSGTALIENNIITGYQKGGIVVDGPGSQATITGNTVIGEGPTNLIAQNGIQVSRGANATVTANTVSGNVYTGPRADPDDFAAGILFFISQPYLGQGGITIGSGNTITANEFGIWTNDARTLTTTSLAGVSGNTRNAVAYFSGGYAGQGPLLEYPAWIASNVALVNAGEFGTKQSGDIVDVGGTLKVTGWSAFAAIQPAVNAVAAGGSIDVASGTYAESVVLNGVRNLTFDSVTLQGLTINSGAAGSGISGSATANGSAGFVFNAPVYLLGDTSLATTGANIALNGDIQGLGGNAYALSLNAGAGDVTLVSGGSAGNPLGKLDVASNNFTLLGTLWVSGYDINALGTVALSDHTLRSVGAGVVNEITAGGDVTGSTVAESAVGVESGGSVIGSYTAPSITVAAQETVSVAVNAPGPVAIHSEGTANVTGTAPSLVIDAPSGSVSGDFGQVTNAGSGLIEVNGKPTVNATLAASADNNRVLPAEITTAASPEAAGPQRGGKVRRRRLEDALEVLENGEALEIDLTPGN
jgi:filamentous hemagglutinin family protein